MANDLTYAAPDGPPHGPAQAQRQTLQHTTEQTLPHDPQKAQVAHASGESQRSVLVVRGIAEVAVDRVYHSLQEMPDFLGPLLQCSVPSPS